jgi:hypothetical protein
MSAAAFFRLKKLKGGGILLAAARHNRRTIQAELGADGHIDPTRSHLNITLCGPPGPDDVPKLAKAAMQAAGVGKLRKDAVVGVEAVFSLPVGHPADPRQYFAACVEWAGLHFGGAGNILSADVHLDEAQPHVHVLVLPLVNGRMVGSDMVGNRRALIALQARFFDEVAHRFGLSKPKARMTGATKADASARVIATMKASNDPALRSHAWPVIRAAIESDPAPFVAALGLVIDAKPKRLKSSTAIFTSTGKGPKKEPKQSNPIGFKAPKKEQTLSCVGFASKPPASTALAQAPHPAHAGHQCDHATDTVRVRDADMHADCWDADTGTFRPRPPPHMPIKAAAQAWVKAALQDIQGQHATAPCGT